MKELSMEKNKTNKTHHQRKAQMSYVPNRKYPKNMWTQNEPQELTEEEREEILQSENLKNFLSFNAARYEA